MTDNTIRFAQLSFWFAHANGICASAQRHPNAELACIWDDDPRRGKAAAEKFNVEYIGDLDEVLQRTDIDAVGICSPTQDHVDHIIRAAEAGKHCLVEKPFTRTPAEADRAIAAARANNVEVMPVYNLRFTPANEKMKELVDSGELGPLYQVRRRHGHREYAKNDYDPQRVMSDPDWPWADGHAEGRRSLCHAGSHAILWMLWMFGMPEDVVSLGIIQVEGLPVEDNNAAVFRYKGGPLVTLHTSETETAAPLATEIYGRHGSVVQVRGDGPSTWAEFGQTGALMRYRESTRKWEEVPGIDRAFQPSGYSPNDRFFDALSKGQPMPISMEDGKRSIQIMAAAELASLEQRQVAISEITG
ncbi:MAG: hypothetical protein GKR89_02570 [Candidatus Latescibacteria bacterium]|nr:hypothetical protein [Candidatus Latescibacterota bacterium]